MNTTQNLGPKGKVRGFLAFFGLHLITLGAYNMFWWFKVAGEVNSFLGTQRMSALKIMFLSPITLGLYLLFWQFSEGRRIIQDVQARAGLPQKAPLMAGPWQFQRSLNQVWSSLPA